MGTTAGRCTSTVRVLPTPVGLSSGAADVNDAGQVLGWVGSTGDDSRAVVWRRGRLVPVPSLPRPSFPVQINNEGLIVVGAYTNRLGADAFYLWSGKGMPRLLRGSARRNADLYVGGISDSGVVVGRVSGDASEQGWLLLWKTTRPQRLELPASWEGVDTTGISRSGRTIAASLNRWVNQDMEQQWGLGFYTAGRWKVVATPAGSVNVVSVSDTGAVSGYVYARGIATAATWTATGRRTTVPFPRGYPTGWVADRSDVGTWIGNISNANGVDEHAVIRRPGGHWRFLESPTGPDPAHVPYVSGINRHGTVVGLTAISHADSVPERDLATLWTCPFGAVS